MAIHTLMNDLLKTSTHSYEEMLRLLGWSGLCSVFMYVFVCHLSAHAHCVLHGNIVCLFCMSYIEIRSELCSHLCQSCARATVWLGYHSLFHNNSWNLSKPGPEFLSVIKRCP